jgi:serine protease Do
MGMRIGFWSIVCLAALSLTVPSGFAQNSRVLVATRGSFLGIGVVDVSPDRAKALNLKEDRGVEVTSVEADSPAAKAGLKEGDVVLQYNGETVQGQEQFVRLVHETPVGREVKLVVWRNGGEQTLTATIGERSGYGFSTPNGSVTFPNFPVPPIEIPRMELSWQSQALGIVGESLGQEQQLAQYFGVQDGVLVKQVIRNSAAEKAGLKAGDVITKVDGQRVSSTRDITSQLRAARARSISVTVIRDKKETTLTVNLEDQNVNPPPPPPGQRF